MSICKLCQEDKPLLESHIIPRHVYKQNKLMPKYERLSIVNVETLKMESITDHAYDGIKEFLFCRECEILIGEYENYYSEVFYKKEIPKKYNISIREKPLDTDVIREYYGLNYDFVKLYFLSIFYRVSMSKDNQYKDYTLGTKHNEIIRKLLLSKKGGPDENYKVMRVKPTSLKGSMPAMFPLRVGKLLDKRGFYWMGIFGGSYIVFKVSSEGVFPPSMNAKFEEFRLKISGEMCEWVVPNQKWNDMIFRYLGNTHEKAKLGRR